MSRLLHLYPRAWRERYGEELVGLTEEHPLTVADRVGLVRGAWDAWRNPEMTPAAALAGGGMAVAGPPVAARAGTRRFAASLSLVAAGLFGLTVVSAILDPLLPHLGWRLPNAMLAVATAVFGLAVWAAVPTILGRLGAVVLTVGGIVMLTWENTAVAAAMPLTVGALLLAASRVVHGRPGWITALLGGGLAAGFWISAWLEIGDLPYQLIMAFAVVPLALALEHRPTRRDLVGATIATLIGAATVFAGTTATSPRILHDGYGLLCGSIDKDECVARADAFVAQIRSGDPDARISFLNVMPYRQLFACGQSKDPEYWPCWDQDFAAAEPSAPPPPSLDGTDAAPGIRP